MTTTFKVATYNVLAEAHIRPERSPLVKPEHFVTATRYPRVVERVVGLDADILCLQEVDDLLFRKLKAALEPLDYRGLHTRYDGKPDGVATFLRWPFWKAFTPRVLRYEDAAWNGGKRSGRLGHVFSLDARGKILSLANVHLKWNPPETPPDAHLGHAQARMLIAELSARPADGCIVCGDLNVMPDDPILDTFRKAGLTDSHVASTMTFNSSDAVGGARKIDFILNSAGFWSHGLPTPEVTDATPLPSDTEPSDHLPLVAKFTFA